MTAPMTMDELLQTIRSLDGVLELAPQEGSTAPPIAWGDHFFYYAPDGVVPTTEQPYATIVTKDYPDDSSSRLDAPDRWRLNIHVGTALFVELIGEEPRPAPDPRTAEETWDFAATDTVLPHPVYRAQGWVSIVSPGERSGELAVSALSAAHEDARRRSERRPSPGP